MITDGAYFYASISPIHSMPFINYESRRCVKTQSLLSLLLLLFLLLLLLFPLVCKPIMWMVLFIQNWFTLDFENKTLIPSVSMNISVSQFMSIKNYQDIVAFEPVFFMTAWYMHDREQVLLGTTRFDCRYLRSKTRRIVSSTIMLRANRYDFITL